MMMKEFKALSESDLSKISGGIVNGTSLKEYTVRTGDTLEKIAQMFMTNVAMLRQINPGLTNLPQVGAKIQVPTV